MMRPGVSIFALLFRALFRRSPARRPSSPLPFVRTNLRTLPDLSPSLVWFGHSSYLLRYRGRTLLVDPVFSGYAAPVPFAVRAFAGTDAYGPAEMPARIDALLVTHDHYDHLDYGSIRALKDRVGRFVVPLGVGAHLEAWGIEAERIVELDWWESSRLFDDVEITATPARHFSGRGLRRCATLWCSFALRVGEFRVFVGGDSGYDPGLRQVGDRLGPFDLALLECGQYNEDWPYVHQFPEQTVLAAAHLRARALLPVHWGKFVLSLHDWREPIRRVSRSAADAGLELVTPRIGEVVGLGGGAWPRTPWWESVE